jgi:hypothetical protein
MARQTREEKAARERGLLHALDEANRIRREQIDFDLALKFVRTRRRGRPVFAHMFTDAIAKILEQLAGIAGAYGLHTNDERWFAADDAVSHAHEILRVAIEKYSGARKELGERRRALANALRSKHPPPPPRRPQAQVRRPWIRTPFRKGMAFVRSVRRDPNERTFEK